MSTLSPVTSIHLNALWGQPHPDRLPQLEKQFQKVTPILKKIFDNCKVSPAYYEARRHLSASLFTINIQFNLTTWFSYSGEKKQYQTALLNECIQKFYYLLNKNFEVSADAFDYIRRINPQEWEKLAYKLEKAPSVNDRLAAIFKKEICCEGFEVPKWPLMAIKTYLSGKISRNQVSKLLLLDCMQQHHSNFTICQLTSEYIHIILDCFFKERSLQQPQWLSALKESLREKIKTLPKQKTQFWTYSIGLTQNKTPRFYYHEGTLAVGILIPPKLLNVIYQTIFGPTYMKTSPVLGQSLPDDFIWGNKRDALIPCRYVTNPTHLHNIRIEQDIIGLYLHDNAHALTESANPERAFWLQFASWVEQKNDQTLWNIVLDRPFFAYLRGFDFEPFKTSRLAAIKELFKQVKKNTTSPEQQSNATSLVNEYFSFYKNDFQKI